MPNKQWGEPGSQMSSRQLVKAAQHGRLVTAWVNLGETHSVTGYVVGLDDYHVLVAMIQDNDQALNQPVLVMLAKGQMCIVRLHTERTYDALKDDYRENIDPIRNSFLAGLEV